MRNNKKHLTHTPPIENSQSETKSLAAGQIIAGRFKLLDKVGQGSFGSIYKTENIETGEICATKFEKRENHKGSMSLLVREIKVLLALKGMPGFPQLYYYGRDENHNYFMISYLGQNLEYLIRKTKSFSTITCLKLGIQLLERIESLHSKNLIHRDLKPENIVIGWHDIDLIYLIDFGLAKYYRESGNHIPMVDKKGIIGTARYASISAHLGKEQSRRDDLESLCYVLIYLNKGKLPWMNLLISDKNLKYQKIQEFKQQMSNEKLCENLPKCYYTLLSHSKSREFTEPPNYAYLKEQFQKALFEIENIEQFSGYDWEKLAELKSKKSKKPSLSPVRHKSYVDNGHQKKIKQKDTLKQDAPIKRREREKEKEEKESIQIQQLIENQQNNIIQETQQNHQIQEKKSQISFLNVPDLDAAITSPDKKQCEMKSRGYLSHNSYGTTKMLNYQISQLTGEDKEMYKRYVSQVSVKRKDSKSFSMMVSKNSKEEATQKNQQQQQQPVKTSTPKKTHFLKEATNHQLKEEVDYDYLSFDNLDLIADEETNLQFNNIGAFSFKKSNKSPY